MSTARTGEVKAGHSYRGHEHRLSRAATQRQRRFLTFAALVGLVASCDDHGVLGTDEPARLTASPRHRSAGGAGNAAGGSATNLGGVSEAGAPGSSGESTSAGGSPGGSLGLGGVGTSGSGGAEGGQSGRRHVIFIVGDGMQLAHEVAASRYLFGIDQGLSFHSFPVRGFVTTWDVSGYDTRASVSNLPAYAPDQFDPKIGYDPALGGAEPYPLLPDSPERRDYFLNGPFPDSASTGTAMSTGHKTDYNNIAWASGDAADGALESSAARLRRERDMAIGFVTTGPISHATPAAWFAHNVDRYNYFEIGKEILLQTQPDVLIGGGVGEALGSFVDALDLEAALATGKWIYARRSPGVDGVSQLLFAAQQAIVQGKGLLGIFGGGAGNFESPMPVDAPGAPLVTRGSLENPGLAEASVAALEVLSQDEQGLFLLVEQADIDWANHNNDYARMIGCMWDLHQAVNAIIDFVDRPGDALDWSNTTLFVTADHANSYLRLDQTLTRGDLPAQLANGAWTYPDAEVSYGTTNHTGELVTLHALGAGAERVQHYMTHYPMLPIIDNTDLYHLTLEAAGQ